MMRCSKDVVVSTYICKSKHQRCCGASQPIKIKDMQIFYIFSFMTICIYIHISLFAHMQLNTDVQTI